MAIPPDQKVHALADAVRLAAGWRALGRSIVFTNGCFDLLHPGHTSYLREARALGDVLIVGLNSDASVRAIKGEKRPILPEAARAEILASLESVDCVVVFAEETPLRLIQALAPGVLVKGGDWKEEEIVGADLVKASGGQVRRIPFVAGYSTSRIIETILLRYG